MTIIWSGACSRAGRASFNSRKLRGKCNTCAVLYTEKTKDRHPSIGNIQRTCTNKSVEGVPGRVVVQVQWSYPTLTYFACLVDPGSVSSWQTGPISLLVVTLETNARISWLEH